MNIKIDTFADICRKNRFVNSIAQYIYLKAPLLLKKNIHENDKYYSSAEGIKIGFICDEMTWLDFKDNCNAIFLSPAIWKKQMEIHKPEILFCESAWSGDICGSPDWRGRIYKNKGVFFENRKQLLELLNYCKAKNIITIFWNKEDPIFFKHNRYDFLDTALYFDWIFTTAEECVTKYEQQGHHQVRVMPFGVNTQLFRPIDFPYKKGRALFAGSWFSDIPERCKAMTELFDHVLELGLDLDIYDRKSESTGANFQYPEKYRKYIKHAVDYIKLPELFSQYEYALNINTVVNSHTMCSRRILQIAACGIKIISNDAIALNNIEGLHIYKRYGSIVYIESDTQMIEKYHSTDKRFQYMLEQISQKKLVTGAI